MINVVFYAPAPGTMSGPIVASATNTEDAIVADGRPYVIVEDAIWNADVTHEVVDGVLVEKEG